jgi:neutral ceramidase
LFSGQGVTRFAVNRRFHRPKITVNELTHELDGPVDHSVPIIKVQKKSGEILAILFGYACHTTTLGIYEFTVTMQVLHKSNWKNPSRAVSLCFLQEQEPIRIPCPGTTSPLPVSTAYLLPQLLRPLYTTNAEAFPLFIYILYKS